MKFAALGALALLGGGVFMVGTPDRGEYYEMQPAEVARRLVAASPPSALGSQTGTSGLSISRRTRDQSKVVWQASFIGQPIALLSAQLEPDGAGTRVAVDFDLAETRMGKAARADVGDGIDFIEAVLKIGMLEHIDSTLDGRPFDATAMQKEMAGFAIRNPGALKDYMAYVEQIEQGGGGSALRREIESQVRLDRDWHSDVSVSVPTGTDPSPADDWGR